MNFHYDPKPLEQARLRKFWTKVQLACKVGVHPVVIARVESGKSHNPKTIQKMAKVLGIDVSEVIKENE